MTITNALTRQIIEYIMLIGGYAWRNNTGAYKAGNRFIRFGKKGSGDVLAVLRGQFYSIEVKVGRDELSQDQKDWMHDIERAGGVCLVARSIDDVMEYFEAKRVTR